MSAPRSIKILLGVTGGVSAYKSADLLRRVQEIPQIAPSITVLPTRASLNFVGEALWEALSGNPVLTDLWQNTYHVPHIQLAREHELIVIAPATADSIARFAEGRADDLLTATVIASTAPKILVPAMHPEMYLNPIVQKNLATLRSHGFIVVEPDEGKMTGEDVGVGRYPESSKVIAAIKRALHLENDLAGIKVLVSSGGTREAIDPIRFIGNHSSGKQGYAIATAAHARGAEVTLVSANVSLPAPDGVRLIKVTSADEMHSVLCDEFPAANLLFMAAAIADAKPAHVEEGKISKAHFTRIELVENPDIVATLSQMRSAHHVITAFAAQTGDEGLELAKTKMIRKGVDLLYFNDVSGGAIFGESSTSGRILNSDGSEELITSLSKVELAHKLLNSAKDKLSFSNE